MFCQKKDRSPMKSSQIWTRQRTIIICGIVALFLVIEYQRTLSEVKSLRKNFNKVADELEQYQNALEFANVVEDNPTKLDVAVAPLADPLIVIGTHTKPPFLIAVFNSVEDRYISRSLLEKGTYGDSVYIENILKQTMLNHKGPNPPFFVDLGSNLGLHSLQAASLGFRVALFEPNPKCVNRIKTSVHLNNFQKRVIIYPNAVGEDVGKATLSINHNSPGMSTLGKNQEELDKLGVEIGGDKYDVEVEVVKVDDYIKEHVDMMKVDVEGFELYAMKGAKQLLTKYGVPWIHMEIFPRMLKATNTEPLDLLKYMHNEMGYDLYYLDKLVPESNYPKFIQEIGGEHRDVVFKKGNSDSK